LTPATGRDDGDRRPLQEICGEPSSVLEEVRTIAYNQRPYQLDRLGLSKTLEAVVNASCSSRRRRSRPVVDDVECGGKRERNRIVREAVTSLLGRFVEPIRILVADDHPVVRNGLRQAIEKDAGLTVIAEAANGTDALARIVELAPAVAVLDIDMPGLDGFGVARAVRAQASTVRVIFLTIHAKEDMFHAAMDLGAHGYVLKDSALTEIVQGIRAVAAGHHYVSPPLTGLLLHRRSQARALAEQQPGLQALTPSERRILRMIADGLSSKAIADTLFIQVRTVDNHRANIGQKLKLTGPYALLRYAMHHRHEL
jgi:DNA-binding NarL/FixJ family response regulator